jgi:hypothetical protein
VEANPGRTFSDEEKAKIFGLREVPESGASKPGKSTSGESKAGDPTSTATPKKVPPPTPKPAPKKAP